MSKPLQGPNPDRVAASPENGEPGRKPWSRPVLFLHGDIRITQAGTSPGAFDSQFPNTRP